MLQDRSRIESVSSMSDSALLRCIWFLIISQTKILLLVLFMVRSLNDAELLPKKSLNGQRRNKCMRFLWPIVKAVSSLGRARIWIVPCPVNSRSYFAGMFAIFFLAAATRWMFWAYSTMGNVRKVLLLHPNCKMIKIASFQFASKSIWVANLYYQ